jgi:hypothetical protein
VDGGGRGENGIGCKGEQVDESGEYNRAEEKGDGDIEDPGGRSRSDSVYRLGAGFIAIHRSHASYAVEENGGRGEKAGAKRFAEEVADGEIEERQETAESRQVMESKHQRALLRVSSATM